MRTLSQPPKMNQPTPTPPMRASSIPPNIQTHTTTNHNNPQQQHRYADVTENNEHQVEDAATRLKNFWKNSKDYLQNYFTTAA